MAKILIVEDEEHIVALMRFVLEKAGHAVSSAGNGKAALEMLGVDPPNPGAELPDLIILDVMMPVMDGYTAALALKNDSRAANVPIVVVTAKTEMRPMFKAIPSVAAFFDKPFDPKQLREIVAKLVPDA